jgi:succinyl-CoA synthetase beta subunit
MLLEHDAKELIAARGIPVPPGRLVGADAVGLDIAPPWIVKAQVPVGGRGKAGGIVAAATPADLRAGLDRVVGMRIKGHTVTACRVEQAIGQAVEAYLACIVDPASAGIRVMVSAEGGVDIEESSAQGHLLAARAEPTVDSVLAAFDELASQLPDQVAGAIGAAARALTPVFFELEALLLEINPLFIRPDGSWVAGDAKIVIDDNAIARRPALAELVARRAEAYPELALKLEQGFDFVALDPDGRIGLVTTGAGLSMQLVDELVQRGHPPLNFCDIRTGQFRGDPARLIQVFRWIAGHASVRAVLINFFAGSTDLGELAKLLLAALAAVPELRVPITARLIGNGLAEARAVLAAAGDPIHIETDLDRAVDRAILSIDEASP